MHIVVGGSKYEIPERMTLGEASQIKRISGLSMGQIGHGVDIGDPDLVAALVLIAMKRSGKDVDISDVYTLDVTEINLGDDEEDDEPGPPAEAPAGKSGTSRKRAGSRSTDKSSK